ncbi:MAG: hypothetical protein ABR886_03205 [Dehalococcoidales bacterium]|jgi:hypothetical protein
MKSGWKFICLGCLVILVILSVAGCGGKPSIVGKWQSADDANNSIEFVQGGTLIADIGGHTVTGTYEVVNNDYVNVKVSDVTGLLAALFNKGTWKYTVTATTLTLSGDIVTRTFTRVK